MEKSRFRFQLSGIYLVMMSFLFISCASMRQSSDPVPELIESARLVISTTINANNFYRDDYNQDALSFVMLEKMDYLMIDPYTKEIFTFELILEDGNLTEIVATTTKDSPVGEGKKVIYNVTTKVWSGDLVELYRSR